MVVVVAVGEHPALRQRDAPSWYAVVLRPPEICSQQPDFLMALGSKNSIGCALDWMP